MSFGIGTDVTFQLRNFVRNVLHDPPRVEVRLKHLHALHEEVEGTVAAKFMESSKPPDRFNVGLNSEWRSKDPGLKDFDLVDHICAKFGTRAAGHITPSAMVAAGRQRLQGPLKLFIFRQLMVSTEETDAAADADRRADYPLRFEMFNGASIIEDFPWTKGAELTEAEAEMLDEMLPDEVKVRCSSIMELAQLRDRRLAVV